MIGVNRIYFCTDGSSMLSSKVLCHLLHHLLLYCGRRRDHAGGMEKHQKLHHHHIQSESLFHVGSFYYSSGFGVFAYVKKVYS